DSIIDLANGYFEQYSKSELNKTILRQATVFNNQDGSVLLGISVNEWDFVCMVSETNFYEIHKSRQKIIPLDIKSVLPVLTYKSFLKDSVLHSDFIAFLNKLDLYERDLSNDFEEYLNQIFSIKFLMPRKGTSVTAYIDVCDYYMHPRDLKRLQEEYFTPVLLSFDRKLKKFVHR
ncbi:MAG: hypothetical protein MRY83_05275, partial [Flavobacteriales bacterium]|nr:hypothetical protein [Flavobacteriales bacterium]